MRRVISVTAGAVLALAAIAVALIIINAFASTPSGDAVREEFSYKSEEIDSIDIEISVAYINVYQSDDPVFTVNFVSPKKGLYTAALEGGALMVRESGSSWFDKLHREDSERYGIEIGVPEGKSVDLRISADTSDVSIDGLTLPGSTAIEVGVGSVTVDGVEAGGYLSADIDTGNVTFGFITCREISAEVDTGDIFIRSVEADKAISLKTDTGKVSGYLVGSREDYTVTATIDTGVSELESGGSGKTELTVSVGTGSIALSLKDGA